MSKITHNHESMGYHEDCPICNKTKDFRTNYCEACELGERDIFGKPHTCRTIHIRNKHDWKVQGHENDKYLACYNCGEVKGYGEETECINPTPKIEPLMNTKKSFEKENLIMVEIEKNMGWEIKLVSELDVVIFDKKPEDFKSECRDWLLGGEHFEWKVYRDLQGIVLMRR
jgi:hypothetical protein